LTEPTTKKVEEKNEEVKTDMLRGIGKQSGGIREVSPEKRKGRLRWDALLTASSANFGGKRGGRCVGYLLNIPSTEN